MESASESLVWTSQRSIGVYKSAEKEWLSQSHATWSYVIGSTWPRMKSPSKALPVFPFQLAGSLENDWRSEISVVSLVSVFTPRSLWLMLGSMLSGEGAVLCALALRLCSSPSLSLGLGCLHHSDPSRFLHPLFVFWITLKKKKDPL